MDIDAIKADREVGTPGKWSDKETKHNEWSISHDDDCMWCFVGPEGKNPVVAVIMLSNVYRAGHRLDANARRIARVPELEDAVIALTARVAEMREALGDMVDLFSADNILRKGTHLNATLQLARIALAKPGYNEYGGLVTWCDNCDAHGPSSEADAAQIIAAWNTRPAPKVKPMEWHHDTDEPEDFSALSAVGWYCIESTHGNDNYRWTVSVVGGELVGVYDDPDIAKAAAQADYSARILAALMME